MIEQFEPAFDRLRHMMLAAAPTMVVTKDWPGSLELRTAETDPKTNERGWFGAVTIKKTYVAVHLMPLYTKPDLAADCSVDLNKRRQGKTCFNFKRIDERLFEELNDLMRRCAT